MGYPHCYETVRGCVISRNNQFKHKTVKGGGRVGLTSTTLCSSTTRGGSKGPGDPINFNAVVLPIQLFVFTFATRFFL